MNKVLHYEEAHLLSLRIRGHIDGVLCWTLGLKDIQVKMSVMLQEV